MTTPFISFPPGLLGRKALRVSLLANETTYFALAKPVGLAAVRDSLHMSPVALLDGLQKEISEEKPQLFEEEIRGAYAIHWPDPEISGIFLCAKTPAAKMELKNAMGALQFSFIHHFLAISGSDRPDEFICDLPIARHRWKPMMLISHKTGKKAFTRFRRLQSYNGFCLWEAESPYDRPHQVRLHAAESGFLIPGEALYGTVPPVSLSSLKSGQQPKEGRPLYSHLCLHHYKTRLPHLTGGELTEVQMPYPKSLQTLLSGLPRTSLKSSAARPDSGT